MNKLWGWLKFNATDAHNRDDLFNRMRDASRAQPTSTVPLFHASCALGVNTQQSIAKEGGLCVALIGQPRLEGAVAAISTAQQLLAFWRTHGRDVLQRIHGPFALAIVDTQANTTLLAIDRVGVQSLAFSLTDTGLIFASRADAVAAHPGVGDALSFQSIFNYFYFYTVPAPGTSMRRTGWCTGQPTLSW